MRTNNKKAGEYTLLGNKNLNNLEKKFDYAAMVSNPLFVVAVMIMIVGIVAISML